MLMQELQTQKVMQSIILLMTLTNLFKKVSIAVPLIYLSNFWRALKTPLINCEVSLILTCSIEYVITSIERRVITNTQRDTCPTNKDLK